LEVTGKMGDSSEMTVEGLGNLLESYNKLRVSFSIYRTGSPDTDQNLWWYWLDNGRPTYGLQWDLGGTMPNGWNPGASSTPTVFGTYTEVDMIWDMTTAKAYSWYNGIHVDDGIPITDITALTGWGIRLTHDASDSEVGDIAYIDNFRISGEPVPEPATMVIVGGGLLAMLARRRR
jgi:hypothetical protein